MLGQWKLNKNAWCKRKYSIDKLCNIMQDEEFENRRLLQYRNPRATSQQRSTSYRSNTEQLRNWQPHFTISERQADRTKL